MVRFISIPGLAVLLLGGCARAPAGVSPLPTVASACLATLPLSPGTPVRASTLFGHDAVTASCVRGAAPECRFALEVRQPSLLRASLESGSFDGSLALYRAGTPPEELRCNDDLPSGDVRHARLEASVAPGSYLLVVDGANGEAGDFELFTELEPLPAREQVCASAARLQPARPTRDSTRGAANLFGGSCGGGDGPEHVHALMLHEPARVRLRQQAEFDGALYLRAACDDGRSELACGAASPHGAAALIAAQLDAGTYYVFSDGFAREQGGGYVLSVEQEAAPAVTTTERRCAEAGALPALAPGRHEIDTLAAPAALAGSCGGEGAPEHLVSIRVERPSILFAQLQDTELNAVLYVRRACHDARSELACVTFPRLDLPRDASLPPLTVALEPGFYTLVVDGQDAGELGAATLDVLLSPRGD